MADTGSRPSECPCCSVMLVGPYCHACGQDNRRARLHERDILLDVAENLFTFDSALVQRMTGIA